MGCYERLVGWLAPKDADAFTEFPPIVPLPELLRLLEAACDDPARLVDLCAAFEEMEGSDGWDHWNIWNDGGTPARVLRQLSLSFWAEDLASPQGIAHAHAVACAALKEIRDDAGTQG